MLPHLYFYDITFLLFCKDTEQALRAEPNNKALQEWRKLSTEFEKSLTPEQVETYHRLSDMQGESATKDNEALYIQGFRMVLC